MNKEKIYKGFCKTIKEYNLLQNNDKLLICISGGKDSYILTKCIEEYIKNKNINFDYEIVLINPGYDEKSLKLIKSNNDFKKQVRIYNVPIYAEINKLKRTSKCFVCSKKRRYNLYKIAEELNCNKIVLGHHKNDVIETILLSIFYSGEFKSMLPKTKSESGNLEIIRPLYNTKESDIIEYINKNKLSFISCSCGDKEFYEKRKNIKNLIKDLKKDNKQIEENIFSSLKNVNLDMILNTKRR